MTLNTSIHDRIQEIEKEEARLAKRKEELRHEAEKEAEAEKKIESFVEDSGMEPRALVQAIVQKYNLRITSKLANPGSTGKRKRTRVTAALRDAIKKEVDSGTSMNAASRQFSISYAVVSKIMKGDYDHLSE